MDYKIFAELFLFYKTKQFKAINEVLYLDNQLFTKAQHFPDQEAICPGLKFYSSCLGAEVACQHLYPSSERLQ